MTIRVQKLNAINSTEWLAVSGHVYTGRFQRILSGKNAGHHWPASCFSNPYRCGEAASLVEKRSKIFSYVERLKERLQSQPMVQLQFAQLVGMAEDGDLTLGCWCTDWEFKDGFALPPCHAVYLARIVELLVVHDRVFIAHNGTIDAWENFSGKGQVVTIGRHS